MGIIISPAQAGILVGRNERIIRGWIASGQLPHAYQDDDGRWQVDTDDLLQAPHVDDATRDHIRRWVADQD